MITNLLHKVTLSFSSAEDTWCFLSFINSTNMQVFNNTLEGSLSEEEISIAHNCFYAMVLGYDVKNLRPVGRNVLTNVLLRRLSL